MIGAIAASRMVRRNNQYGGNNNRGGGIRHDRLDPQMHFLRLIGECPVSSEGSIFLRWDFYSEGFNTNSIRSEYIANNLPQNEIDQVLRELKRNKFYQVKKYFDNQKSSASLIISDIMCCYFDLLYYSHTYDDFTANLRLRFTSIWYCKLV